MKYPVSHYFILIVYPKKNNFISFYIKAKEYYSNIEIDINKDINCNSFKIYNMKY